MRPFICFADCEVQYDGRATSVLDRGNYLIIIKPDSSLLIHGATLSTTLNYMPAGAKITHSGNTITASRKNETIIITIYKILSNIIPELWSYDKIRLVKTESELRDKLASNLTQYIPGYDFKSIVAEAYTEVGPCDILAIDVHDHKHIVELKRHKITISSVVQLRKYLETIPCSIGYVAAPMILPSALLYCKKYNITYIKINF